MGKIVSLVFVFGLLSTMLVPFAMMDAHAQIPPKDPELKNSPPIIFTANAGYNEVGDAGSLPGSSQSPVGSGGLSSISGTTSPGDFEDLYTICISNPSSFIATTEGLASWDTVLNLFEVNGDGVQGNDDRNTLQAKIDPTGPNPPTTSKLYVLAITGFSNFPFDGVITMVTGPLVNSQYTLTGTLDNWPGGGAFGSYTIGLTGVDFPSSCTTVGGTSVPIDQSALLLAGVQSISMWMIPVLIAGIGIGVFVIKRRR